jgi:hypothetical protein
MVTVSGDGQGMRRGACYGTIVMTMSPEENDGPYDEDVLLQLSRATIR